MSLPQPEITVVLYTEDCANSNDPNLIGWHHSGGDRLVVTLHSSVFENIPEDIPPRDRSVWPENAILKVYGDLYKGTRPEDPRDPCKGDNFYQVTLTTECSDRDQPLKSRRSAHTLSEKEKIETARIFATAVIAGVAASFHETPESDGPPSVDENQPTLPPLPTAVGTYGSQEP